MLEMSFGVTSEGASLGTYKLLKVWRVTEKEISYLIPDTLKGNAVSGRRTPPQVPSQTLILRLSTRV